jgi:diacylglycerol kinase family enzyme
VYVLGEDDDAHELATEAAERGAETLGMAGGDGSLSAVAAVALEQDLPFVPVPFGTRNHFARDVGFDRDDPLAALAAFEGRERSVDVGFVGDQLFLNNVSLGLYAAFVHDPERKTRNRLVAFLRMIPAALGRSRRPLSLSFEVEGRSEHHNALIVLVGNNDYRIESMSELGERQTLDEGLLHAYVVEAASRTTLVGLLLKAAIGKADDAEALAEWSAARFAVESGHPRIHAAVDGEPVVLNPPLEFEIRPRALRVRVPAKA